MWWQRLFERQNRRKRCTRQAMQVDFEGIETFAVPMAQPGSPATLRPADALYTRVLVPAENKAGAGTSGPRRLVSV
jgi:hypothetical protein